MADQYSPAIQLDPADKTPPYDWGNMPMRNFENRVKIENALMQQGLDAGRMNALLTQQEQALDPRARGQAYGQRESEMSLQKQRLTEKQKVLEPLFKAAIDSGDNETIQKMMTIYGSDQDLAGSVKQLQESGFTVTGKGETKVVSDLTKDQIDQIATRMEKQDPTMAEAIRRNDAGSYEIKTKNGKITEFIPSTIKNKTPEQLAELSLKEKLGRQPTYTEITQQLQKDKLEQQRAARAIITAPNPEVRNQAQEIAAGIMDGTQPPELSGFGMAKFAGPVRAILHKNGYDLTKATLDYQAQKKYVASLNGAQQVRLRQATDFAYGSLDLVEDLAKQWKAGGYAKLNKVNLIAAKNGLLGKDANRIAVQLETQIADLTSELATVYKGGNSSTDESLKLAATNLKSEWSEDVLLKNVDLVRKNLAIRKNSQKFVGATTTADTKQEEKKSSGLPQGFRSGW